jgi:hypothetical protein
MIDHDRERRAQLQKCLLYQRITGAPTARRSFAGRQEAPRLDLFKNVS